uniref:Uncharacterized protein n=1 Tax=Timema monikensis TaxID=170555 RepID=A0A7R9EDC5_9NEOP|nr:unnamed protein product [Timema monikensis]
MAQEIIKAASKLHEPYDNMFFFNPTTNGGFIECVGKSYCLATRYLQRKVRNDFKVAPPF